MLEESPGIDKVRGEESVTRLSSMALRYVGRIAGAGRDEERYLRLRVVDGLSLCWKDCRNVT